MINAGILIIYKHRRDNVSLLFPIFENYLNKKASDEEMYDLVREGVVTFTGALAKYLGKTTLKSIRLLRSCLMCSILPLKLCRGLSHLACLH
ncbi:hypothetical protein SOVF_122110 [Spinacia oleracea]|nr:hypothetical protein SOVF_122110 [Spinacia oleracea]